MKKCSRAGFTLVELLLFLGILTIIGGGVTTMIVWTQDARLTQRTSSDVEQNGERLLLMMTRMARRAEKVLEPAAGKSGSILNLQMADPLEFPTIFAVNASGALVMVQRDDLTSLLSPSMRVKNLLFKNASSGTAKTVTISFTLEATVPTPQKLIYKKDFRGAITLYPDDFSEAGGCGQCVMTGCVAHVYKWSYCLYETCTAATTPLGC